MTAPAFVRCVAVAAVLALSACRPGALAITAISPAQASVGSTVTLTGTGFGDSQGSSTLTVGGVAATATAWSATSIAFTVPAVGPGAHTVALGVGGATADTTLTVIVVGPRFLYACDDRDSDSTVSGYAIESDGQLTPLPGSPWETGDEGVSYGGMSNCIRIHAASHRLYAANGTTVSIFSIDPSTGVLSRLAGSPAEVASGRSPRFYSLDISPDGNTVFLPDSNNGEVIVAHVEADGSLTEHSGSPYETFTGGASVAELRPDGAFLYVQPEDNYLEHFSVAGDGALTAIDDYEYSDSGEWTVRINAAGTRVALGAADVAVMNIDATTGIPTAAPGSPLTGPSEVGAIAWHPSGNFLYVADWEDGELYGWSIAANGAATPLAGSPWPSPGADSPGGLEVTSDGAFLFVGFEDDQGIASYSLDANGIPTRVGTELTPHIGQLSFLVSAL